MMFYKINLEGRWIAAQIEYDTIDWNSFDAIVDAFNSRLLDWYIKPADILQSQPEEIAGHLAFPIMAIDCIVLETLSQFVKGSGKANFKLFVGQRIPEFATVMPQTIRHKDPQSAEVVLTTFSDVLYHAFRCGILHETHVACYGMVRGGPNIVEQLTDKLTWYAADNSDCPTVTVDPWKLLARVKEAITWYITKLKDRAPENDDLRDKFKTKFSECFGVNISSAV